MKPARKRRSGASRSGRLFFSGRLPGTWSDPKVITLTNRGTLPLLISAARITGRHKGDFAICTQDFSGVHLYPGSSCNVCVRFKPLGSGWRTAVLLLYERRRRKPWRIALVGYGAALELDGNCPDLTVRLRDIARVQVVAVGSCEEPAVVWGKAAIVAGSNCAEALHQELLIAVPISVNVRAHCEGSCDPVTATFHSVAVQPAQVTLPIRFGATSPESNQPANPQPNARSCRLQLVQRLKVEVPLTIGAKRACRQMKSV